MNTIKNVLITGASSGIGEALALHYAKNGVKTLFSCGRNKERLENTANECKKSGTDVYAKVLDGNQNLCYAGSITRYSEKRRLS